MSQVLIPDEIKDFTTALKVKGAPGSCGKKQLRASDVPIILIRKNGGDKIKLPWGKEIRERKWLICVQNDMEYKVTYKNGGTTNTITITVKQGFVCDGVSPKSILELADLGQIEGLEAAILYDWLDYKQCRDDDDNLIVVKDGGNTDAKDMLHSAAVRHLCGGQIPAPVTGAINPQQRIWKHLLGFLKFWVLKHSIGYEASLSVNISANGAVNKALAAAEKNFEDYRGGDFLKIPIVIMRNGQNQWRICIQNAMKYNVTEIPFPRFKEKKEDIAVTVPAGFTYDGATIVFSVVRIVISQLDTLEASALHDWIYGNRPYGGGYIGSPPRSFPAQCDDREECAHARKQADEIFASVLRDICGLERLQWCAGYAAVRKFGGLLWPPQNPKQCKDCGKKLLQNQTPSPGSGQRQQAH